MTIKKLTTLNASNFVNFSEPKIVKRYDDTPKENNTAQLSNTDKISDISFEKKDTSGLNFQYPAQDNVSQEPVQQKEELNQDAATRRAARRTEWKQAADVQRRAMQMQKEAEDKLKQAKKVEELLLAAKKDPTAVADALGLDKTEFLRQYQNQMFNIPNEQAPAQNTVDERLKRYEEERQKEREQFVQLQSETIKQNYMTTKILPVILADKDKFEILNDDPQLASAYIYDELNKHFRATGEEINPVEFAEELENMLVKQMEEQFASTRKYKKLAKHFAQIEVPQEQLGENDSNKITDKDQLGAPEVINTRQMRTTQGLPTKQQVGYIPAKDNSPPPSTSNWVNKRERKLQQVTERILGNKS